MNGYKYHFRVYYFIHSNKEIYYYRFLRMVGAKNKYDINNLNYYNVITGEIGENTFPYLDHFPINYFNQNQINFIYNQIYQIGKILLLILQKYNLPDFYHLLGADIMIDENLNLKIAEVNTKPYFGINPKYKNDLFYRNDLIKNIKYLNYNQNLIKIL